MPIDVNARKNESGEKLLRRFKKKVDRENIIKDAKSKRHFEKPSEVKRRKEKIAAFNNMLKQKRENGLYTAAQPVPQRS